MLPPEDNRRAEEIFEAALQRAPEDRESFIAAECSGQSALAHEVRLLLTHYEAAPPEFLQTGPRETETFGPYELKEVLGEGGMGVVYRAVQREPVARTVALKVLKLGMDSREILNRFEAERQALARLEHPNIARVYDAGLANDGRPYFVMEYVQGEPINTYCDKHRLTPRQRIELFIDLCKGVQYAHQQGIIHRDLKPMNIIVSEQDGRPVPKVIDFGVAKAVQQGLDEGTLFTQLGQLIGTPEYMSPEQAEASPVDTRTDVYSLGAVLYELLVGALPIETEALRSAGAGAMMRLIREQDPPRPSTRASTLAGSTNEVARRRSVAPRVLARTLRGELDWIALKALAKDRERRYPSVGELAADLKHHLADEPVTARPASTWYLLGKFVRRHRVGVTVGLTIGLAVAALAVGSAYHARRIAKERDRANHKAAVATQVKDFLTDIFNISDPFKNRKSEITAREMLDRGAQKVGAIEDPAVRAELCGTLAEVYKFLGRLDTSDSLYVEAKNLWLQSHGLDHPQTLHAITDLGSIHHKRGRIAEAESLYTVALRGWDRLGRPDDRLAMDTKWLLASTLRSQGRFTEAESLYAHTLGILIPLDGQDDLDVLLIRSSQAFSYVMQSRNEEASAIFEDVLERQRRVLGDESLSTITTMISLGSAYNYLSRFDEAEVLLVKAQSGARRVVGEDHPTYQNSVEALASLYLLRKEPARAIPLYEEVLAIRSHTVGAEHPSTNIAMNNLASVHRDLGNYAKAEDLATQALAWRLQSWGDEHPYTQNSRYLMAKLTGRRGAMDEAMGHLQIAIDHGFANAELLDDDTLEIFESIGDRPEFQALLETVRERLEKGENE